MFCSVFRCDFENAKKTLFRCVDAIYKKMDDMRHLKILLQAKCLPALLYGLDPCLVNSIGTLTETQSYEFALFRFKPTYAAFAIMLIRYLQGSSPFRWRD